MDHLDATVRARLAAVAAALQARVDEVTADVEQAIRDAIPQFADGAPVAGLREASIGANVATLLRLVSHGIDDVDAAAPEAALAYARRLAEEGTPPALIVRCYRVGQSRFLRHCLEELSRQDIPAGVDGRQVDNVASIVMIDHISDFIDRVLDQVLTAYEEARGRGTRGPNPVNPEAPPDLDCAAESFDPFESSGAFSRFGRPRDR